jgi:hypothetical protein
MDSGCSRVRYRVGEGWRVKGTDGVKRCPGEFVALPEGDTERLLRLGAVTKDWSGEEEIPEDEPDSGDADGREAVTENETDRDSGDGLDDGAVSEDAEQIPAAGGDISGPEADSASGLTDPAPKKPKGGRAK